MRSGKDHGDTERVVSGESQIIWGDEPGDSPERTQDVIKTLEKLQLKPRFNLVEFACGRGTVLRGIGDRFPAANLFGVDVRMFEDDWFTNGYGIVFLQRSVQRFIEIHRRSHWDVVVFLNSYRNWAGEDKEEFDAWLLDNADYFLASGENGPARPVEVVGRDARDHDLKLYRLRDIGCGTESSSSTP